MSGVPCGNGFLLNTSGSPSTPSTFRMVDMSREPLLPSSQLCRSTTPPPVGSYVPPGYIYVDHSKNKQSHSTVTSPERDKDVWYWSSRPRGGAHVVSMKRLKNLHEYITVTADWDQILWKNAKLSFNTDFFGNICNGMLLEIVPQCTGSSRKIETVFLAFKLLCKEDLLWNLIFKFYW